MVKLRLVWLTCQNLTCAAAVAAGTSADPCMCVLTCANSQDKSAGAAAPGNLELPAMGRLAVPDQCICRMLCACLQDKSAGAAASAALYSCMRDLFCAALQD
jgi:hypothetical protein